MAGSEIILGIDFGTSYSTAATVMNGKIYFAKDSRGESCVPSLVHFPKKGPPVVGFEAEKFRASDPQATVAGVKRLIGRGADSSERRLFDQISPVRVKPGGVGEAILQVPGGDRSASDVGALILQHLKAQAESRFQQKVTKAVLTIPVKAGPAAHAAMVRCGKMAGLEILQIVPEPCAGAISQGRSSTDGMPLLVFDFGGGTFDSTVMRYEEKRMKVLSTGGDEVLGGDNFDQAFAKMVAGVIYKATQKDVTKDAVLWDRVARTCETVKRALSRGEESRYQIPNAFLWAGQDYSVNVNVTRRDLAPHWAELVNRAVMCAAATLVAADVTDAELSRVLMIGGTSFIPQVQAAVKGQFKSSVVLEADPQTAVARGAALVAAYPEILAAQESSAA